ncbi:MAG TPA: TerC family protein [Actinomycetota bacterium]|nr:TerC family protein [Actinomycetota bacterium]
MDVSWPFYAGFIAFVVAMLLVDLKLFHAEEHEPSVRESATWVGIWITLALAFGIGVLVLEGGQLAGEYFAGYLIEYSLSVDNMFVFVVIFSYFKVPRAFQHQVLFFGILGAIIFRGLFIWAGTALIQSFHWVIYVFGAFLIFTAYRIARGATENIHPEDNPVLKMVRRRFPATHEYDGQKLFTVRNGKRLATPLFIVLVFIEFTDILFAVDSIPAIFGVTKEPFIVLTSNVFAILGLRALYFLVAGGMDRLHLLNYGLAAVLAFVGVKMLLEAVHVEVPIWLSLLVIVVALGVTTAASLLIPERPGDEDRGPPGGGGGARAEEDAKQDAEKRS